MIDKGATSQVVWVQISEDRFLMGVGKSIDLTPYASDRLRVKWCPPLTIRKTLNELQGLQRVSLICTDIPLDEQFTEKNKVLNAVIIWYDNASLLTSHKNFTIFGFKPCNRVQQYGN